MGLPLWIKTGICWWTGFILRRVELLLLKSSTLDLYSIPFSSKAILTLAAKGLISKSSRTTSLAICCTKRIKIFLSFSICNEELRRKQEFIAEHESSVEFSVSLLLLGASLLLSLLASEWSPCFENSNIVEFPCTLLHYHYIIISHFFWRVGIFLATNSKYLWTIYFKILLVEILNWITKKTL